MSAYLKYKKRIFPFHAFDRAMNSGKDQIMAVNTFECLYRKDAESSDKNGGITQSNSKIHLRAYEKSTPEKDQTLAEGFSQGTNIQELTVIFERQPSVIKSRLQKSGLLDRMENP